MSAVSQPTFLVDEKSDATEPLAPEKKHNPLAEPTDELDEILEEFMPGSGKTLSSRYLSRDQNVLTSFGMYSGVTMLGQSKFLARKPYNSTSSCVFKLERTIHQYKFIIFFLGRTPKITPPFPLFFE